MKKVVALLKQYFTLHFNLPYFIAIVLFTAALVAVEYTLHFERNYIDYEMDSSKRLLRYVLMYSIAFGGAYLLYLIQPKHRKILLDARLWLLIGLAAFLFSFRTWFQYFNEPLKAWAPAGYQTLTFKYIYNLQGLVLLFFPIAIYWFWADRKSQPLYGFKTQDVLLKPYLILLLLMVPLIVGAATQPDFLDTYPRVNKLDIPTDAPYKTALSLLYELCYVTDFVTTEFFFRGFLILAFIRYAGPQAILPMCVFYVTIHFGKPLGETISSFFGGWILGILAYETRSIYGGIIVHVGIALLMEIVAILAGTL